MKASEIFEGEKSSLRKTFLDSRTPEERANEPVGVTTTTSNVGMLRQWLNEDRITDPKKMVSNADILYWLNLKS